MLRDGETIGKETEAGLRRVVLYSFGSLTGNRIGEKLFGFLNTLSSQKLPILRMILRRIMLSLILRLKVMGKKRIGRISQGRLT